MKIYRDGNDNIVFEDQGAYFLLSDNTRVPDFKGEAPIGKRFPDGSFVYLRDTMGSDAAIVQAARVSYGKGTKSVSEDSNLLRYLMRHQHTTPFEMCEASWHAKMPIFVARQWVRHRTASINEYSMRYSEAPEGQWSPESWRSQSSTNKQSSDESSEGWDVDKTIKDSIYEQSIYESTEAYQQLLTKGACREQARAVLPVGSMTEWYWKCDLKNTLGFLRLRCDHHAQKEMRVFADAMKSVLSTVFPSTMNAAEDYLFGSMSLSRLDIVFMCEHMSTGCGGVEVAKFEDQDTFVSKREYNECITKMSRINL